MAGDPRALSKELAECRARVGADVAALRRWPDEARRALVSASPLAALRGGPDRPYSAAALAGMAALGIAGLVALIRSRRAGA